MWDLQGEHATKFQMRILPEDRHFLRPLDERQCEQTPLPHAAFSAILGDAERRKGDGGHASGIRHADGGIGAQERAYAGA